MTYNYRTGATKKRTHKPHLFIAGLLLLVAGTYAGITILGAMVSPSTLGETEKVTRTLVQRQPELREDRLYIPKIGVDVSVVRGVNEQALEGGAWHRAPENGDPITGGNFVLAAHRFNLGLTPSLTRAKSPFYHIDKLQDGDDIYVDYKGVRYAYKISKKYDVPSTQTEIESRTKDTRLTLYSCNLAGPEKGRDVIEAKPVGTIAWLNGEPKLKVTQ
ncbi:MAG: sortase [Candidatus Saccharimonadales bacterium]